MNDDNDPPVSKPPVAEKEDPNEDERQVEEPDLVTRNLEISSVISCDVA